MYVTMSFETPNSSGALMTRGALIRAAAGAAALTATARTLPAIARNIATNAPQKVRVGWVNATCQAPIFSAYKAGFFEREGLDVELVGLGTDILDAIGSGKIDATANMLYYLLKPIEQGMDVKLSAGLHGGCVRVVASKASGVLKIADLKGKDANVAVESIGGASMTFFALLLSKQGLDPLKDVNWRAIPPPLMATAVEKGEVQVVATGDPYSYFLLRDGKAVELANNSPHGIFYADSGVSHKHFCCYTVLHGELVRNDPKTAAKITRGLMNASRWVGGHIHEAALIQGNGKYIPNDPATEGALLATYEWHPSADLVLDDIELGARDFKRAGVLDPRTDPQQLAAKAYVDIFKLAAT